MAHKLIQAYYTASRHPVQWRKSKLLPEAITAIKATNNLTFVEFADLAAYVNRLFLYDWMKAFDVKARRITVYSTDIDKILASHKGICLDFAVVLAAMCRSCGIPCKVVYGYTTTITGRLYHAWVSAYYDGGWHDYDPTYAKLGVKNVKYERKAER